MGWIERYVRRDGTVVRGHWRSPAGAGRQTLIFLGVVAAVALGGAANGGGTRPGAPGAPRVSDRPEPRWTASYPVRPHSPRPRPEPTWTVSYPVRWER
ncbi:hypothetical protein [Streptomyces sp. NPDC047046]|uniref:hypothetical protein n=1 Tax=Streptomyces sp. NPDC047046 TaxID=3155378 RepID=UPI00340E3BE4